MLYNNCKNYRIIHFYSNYLLMNNNEKIKNSDFIPFSFLLTTRWSWCCFSYWFIEPVCLCPQRWRGTDRLLHCHRRHAGADKTRKVCGHLRSCDMHAGPEKLHGADRRSVHLHPRGTARICNVWKHWSTRQEPLQPHSETDANPSWRDCQYNGTGV